MQSKRVELSAQSLGGLRVEQTVRYIINNKICRIKYFTNIAGVDCAHIYYIGSRLGHIGREVPLMHLEAIADESE